MKSASSSRSARHGSSEAAVAVVQELSPGWCAGWESACRAMQSSASGEGANVIRSVGRPAMSMVTLIRPFCRSAHHGDAEAALSAPPYGWPRPVRRGGRTSDHPRCGGLVGPSIDEERQLSCGMPPTG